MRSTLQSDGTLKEMPEMDEPKMNYWPEGTPTHTDYILKMRAYNTALSKCRQLQVVGTHGWKTGDVVECGKDYKLEIQCSLKSRCECSQGLKVLEGINEDCLYSSYVAVPIADSQEELWREAFDILLNSGDVYSYSYAGAIEHLKEKGFTISKKK